MNTTTEKSAIEKLLYLYGEAINAEDVLKTIALYTEDGLLMPQGAPVAKGPENLKAAYEGLFKAFQLKVKYFTEEIIVNGDYAYVRTYSNGSTLIRVSGVTIPVDNKELFVLRRETEEWKVLNYIFNNNKIK